METYFRSVRSFYRLFRKSAGITSYRCVSNTAVKEEINSELLNSFNQDIKNGGVVPVFRRALLFPTRVAVQDDSSIHTYGGLYQAASALSKDIAAQLLGDTERTISYMCSNDASHVIVQWAIWMTGNIAVPLTPLHPAEMLKYFITDSSSSMLVCGPEFESLLRPIAQSLSKPLLVYDGPKNVQTQKPNDRFNNDSLSSEFYAGTEAMLIYTSGTTSKPKGVVWTHSMLMTQIAALHSAWQYCAQDVVLHTLPLHHIHGQLNSLNASLAAGARVRMLPSFAAHTVWAKLLGAEKEEARVTVFHGVPAMYSRLAAEHASMFADNKTRQYVRDTLAKMRLMCAGSAPLPQSLFNKWEEISGQRLLERYGMSEVGMALSNPYRPVEGRSLGCVGLPLPGVAARVVRAGDGVLEPLVTVEAPAPDTQISLSRLGLSSAKEVEGGGSWSPPDVTVDEPNHKGTYEGELLLRGPAVFTRYWNKLPTLTSKDFTPDGWFRTGDTASFSDGKFKILGRMSVDIIKTGGYKVSALQVESALLEHPSVADAAVLGIEDEDYGEIVATVIVLKENTSLTLRELKDAAGKLLAPYQLPKTMVIVKEMPRNVMGKLDKKEIRKQFGKELAMKKA